MVNKVEYKDCSS